MLLLRTSRGVDPGIPLLRSLGSSAHVWLPGANGVNVASLPSNNYLLSAGSTGYSTVDGVIGLGLDGMGAVGAEFLPVMGNSTSYPFDTFSGSAGGFDGATLTAKIGGAVSTNTLSVTANLLYRLTLNVVSASRDLSIRLVTDRTGASGSALSGIYNVTGVGPKTIFIQATGTGTAYLQCNNGGSAIASYSVTDISVKEYTGTHLTQATTANKPLVRRGAYNLLTYSNDFTNAAWTAGKSAGATVGALTTGPDGTLSARQVTYATASEYLNQGIASYPAVTGAAATIAAVVKSAVQLIAVGGATAAGTDVFTSASMGGGWYLQAVTRTFTTTTSFFTFQVLPISTIAGAGTYDYYRGGLFRGSFTAAQILAEGGIPTTTATAASNPSAGKYWWSFDGSNDSMLSGNLGITNACTIVIAGRLNSLAATQMLFAETTNGVQVSIATDGSVSFAKVGDAALVATAAGVVVAGVPFVLTARLSAGTADIRKNGAQSATAASATVFAAVTGARIGTAFDGTTSPTGGALGWVVPLPAALSDADCLTVERLVSSQFPNGPVF